jgi:hypothetical protein
MRLVSVTVTLVIVFCLVFILCYQWASSFRGTDVDIDDFGDGHDVVALRAVLIDALYSTSPNDLFVNRVNRTLHDSGFEVDVYRGQEVTVDFLKRLSGGYKLAILRMHSALSKLSDLYFFTAESYSSGRYVQEQSFQLVKEAYATESSQAVFAVNWGFIKKLMDGKFNSSLLIAMGCDSASDSLLIQEFMRQGAVGYVGWNDTVLLSHSDQAVAELIECVYENGFSLKDAVDNVDSRIGADPTSGATLKCYVP